MKRPNDYFKKAMQWLGRQWQRVANIQLAKIMQQIGGAVDVLRVIGAGLLQLVVVVSAGICAIKGARLAYELRLWDAVLLLSVCALLVSIALLTDYYTRPRESKPGGGGG